jgi:chromosome segregation ATPase
MNTSEFKTSINQLESELTTSREKLRDQFKELKSEIKDLQQCIVEKNEQIAALKAQKKDLISLLDQAFAIIDDPSHTKLLEDLTDVRTDVQALLKIGKSEDREAAADAPTNGAAPATPANSEARKGDPGDSAKKWAKDILKGVATGPNQQGT